MEKRNMQTQMIWIDMNKYWSPFFKDILKWSTCAYSKVTLLHWDLATHLLRRGEGLRASDLLPVLEKYGW